MPRFARRAAKPTIVGTAAFAAFMTLATFVRPVEAVPVIGFLETWSDGTPAGWDGNSGELPTNPGTGGVDGAGDGFLLIARSGLPTRLGSKNQTLPYTGDWLAAGVNRVRFYLNDVDEDQSFEIHFAIGNSGNFWQYNVGFLPPENSWAEFTANLSDSANWTRIIAFGPGGFAAALQNTDRVLIRHDRAPFGQTPDAIAGEVGVDNFLMTNALVDVGPVGPGLPAGPIAGRPVRLAPPFPNPARGAVACVLETFEPGPVHLRVVDARGRVVRTAALPAGPAGPRAWMWDGLDDAGRPVAAGVYRIHARGKTGGMSRPVVRVE